MEKEEDIAAFKDYKDDGNDASAKKAPAEEQAAAPEKSSKNNDSASKKEQSSVSTAKKTTTSSSSGEARVAASPLARKLAQENSVDIEVSDTRPVHVEFSSSPLALQSLHGSGPNGRIVVEDVEKFLKDGGASAKSTSASKASKDDRAASSKPAKKDKEVSRGAGGFNEQQISDLRAVSHSDTTPNDYDTHYA